MIIKYTQEEFDKAQYKNLLKLECDSCHKDFLRPKKHIIEYLRGRRNNKFYCSLSCSANQAKKGKICKCHTCGKEVYRKAKDLQHYLHSFCSRECYQKYDKGKPKNSSGKIQRSFMETWIGLNIKATFPNLEVSFNSKEHIGLELDIYFPALKLAIEINGIFHYQPIFGEDKLDKVQNNDTIKLQRCQEQQIDLIVIDISHVLNRPSLKILNSYSEKVIKIVNDRILELAGHSQLPLNIPSQT